ncbi:MAG: hypothetical protein Q9187_005674 [Circinaria calcarea]
MPRSSLLYPPTFKIPQPKRNTTVRRADLACAISESKAEAMVACSQCARHGLTCYYDRSEPIKCAECLRSQRDCDGTFSLEEFRKVGEQKRLLKKQAQERHRETSRLRSLQATARKEMQEAALRTAEAEERTAAAELEEAALAERIARLKEISRRMLQREMLALGVMNPLDNEQEVVLAEPDLVWTGELPVMESIDWDVVLGSADGISLPQSG